MGYWTNSAHPKFSANNSKAHMAHMSGHSTIDMDWDNDYSWVDIIVNVPGREAQKIWEKEKIKNRVIKFLKAEGIVMP